MAALLVSHGRPGFYMRVLEEGEVEAGDTIEFVAGGPERMSVAEVNAQLYLPGHSSEKIEQALRIPALSPGWRESFEALLRQDRGEAGNAALEPADAKPAAWSGFRDARIATLNHETSDIVSLNVASADGTDLTPPLPGQFAVLKVKVPSQPEPVMRSFSICGFPSPSIYRFGIKCEPQSSIGTYLRDIAKVGDALQVSAPRGAFVLQAGDEPVVFVSAGIGITPVLAMLQTLVNAASHRDVWWLYAARNKEEEPFTAVVRALLTDLAGSHSHVWYSRPKADDVLGRDYDSAGHIDVSSLAAMGVKSNAQFYLCGPQSFLDDVSEGLVAWGVARERIYSEKFGSGSSVSPGVVSPKPNVAPHPPAGPAGTGPAISFARSALVASWSPTYRSILEFAEACDVPVRWQCRTGVCHTCETGLVSGDVAYDPEPLDPPAAGNLLLCCSQPRNDVVLDL